MGIALTVVTILLVLTFWIYWKSLSDSRALRSYALLILLDEGVYHAQRQGLIQLVETSSAKSANELATKVMLSVDDLANRLAKTSTPGVHAGLWQIKKAALASG
jgi:hypothetical protein